MEVVEKLKLVELYVGKMFGLYMSQKNPTRTNHFYIDQKFKISPVVLR